MRRRKQKRRGTILVLATFFMVALMALAALTLDVGFLCNMRAQLQNSADAAAMAAAWELIDENAVVYGDTSNTALSNYARESAAIFARSNSVGNVNPELAEQDVIVGHRLDPFDTSLPIITNTDQPLNTVRVKVRRASDLNGKVPLFFARVLGHDEEAMQAEATAALLTSVRGFQSNGENLGILPFALDLDTWIGLMTGDGGDIWSYDADGTISPGSDGVLEANLFPQGTGSPGNRGTVDIGSSNNSTRDLIRQILEGVSPADLEHHGGKLELNENGELFLNADTGISAAVKCALEEIKGRGSVIPLFREVAGNGNNATYTIVGFAGVRILDVKLTGKMKNKHVTIQPAPVTISGGIPGRPDDGDGDDDDEGRPSYFVYSPVRLVK